jgi:hypothetical protein
MSGTSVNHKDVYLNGDLVEPLSVPKMKLYEKISQQEINDSITKKQKELKSKKEGGDVKED